MKLFKQILYLLYEIIIVYYIYSISVVFLKIGFNEMSRNIFFISVGLFLLIPLFKTFKLSKGTKITELENYSKINNVIRKMHNINRLDNPVLKYKNEKCHFDFLIITPKGIFNVIKSNLKGNIKILNDSEWFIKTRKQYVNIKSPVTKIKKFRKILRGVFDEDIIYDVIVLMEDKVNITGEENSKVQIIRYNELKKFITEYSVPEKFDSDELYDKLYPILYSNKDTSKEIALYQKYINSKWKYRGRLTVVLIAFVFYIEKVVYTL